MRRSSWIIDAADRSARFPAAVIPGRANARTRNPRLEVWIPGSRQEGASPNDGFEFVGFDLDGAFVLGNARPRLISGRLGQNRSGAGKGEEQPGQ